jgi:hypothetical protein
MRVSTSEVLIRTVLVWAAAMPLLVSGQIIRARVSELTSPYTAEYRLTRTQRLADGNLINLESKEVVAVDSQHRRMTSKTETLVPEGHPLGTRVIVFDPVARTLSIWTAPGQRATIDAMPEPGASRGCPSNASRGEGVNPGVSRPKPVVEDLGTDTIQGIEARGTRRTTTTPAGEVGNQAPLVRTRETWIAVNRALADLVVREISDDPQSGRTTRELVSLDQREPDEASFHPPAGYEIVNRTTSQTSCSTEAASTQQQ